MKKKDCNRILYFVSIFAPIIYIVLNKIQNLQQISYARNFGTPIVVFFLSILTPIVVSFLFFVKILFQRKMGSAISKSLNILVTVLLIIGIVLFYKGFDFWFLAGDNPMLIFISCLQICSLVYDLFLNRG